MEDEATKCNRLIKCCSILLSHSTDIFYYDDGWNFYLIGIYDLIDLVQEKWQIVISDKEAFLLVYVVSRFYSENDKYDPGCYFPQECRSIIEQFCYGRKGNSITETLQINEILKEFSDITRENILRRAWTKCNDMDFLRDNFEKYFVIDGINPWDGKHETEKHLIEFIAVFEAMKEEQVL